MIHFKYSLAGFLIKMHELLASCSAYPVILDAIIQSHLSL